MRGRFGGLVPRTLVASVFVAALVCAVLVALLVAVARANHSLDRQSHAKEAAVAAVQVQGVVDDLDATLRGYTLTRSGRLRASWDRTRRTLRTDEQRLIRLTQGDAAERRRRMAVTSDIASYLTDYALPLFGIAAIQPYAATQSLALVEGKRRLDLIHGDIQHLLGYEDARASASAHSVRSGATGAIAVGVGVLLLSIALILLFGLYLATAVARPIRAVAAAAGEVATGQFSERLPERGPGEVADLARAFNAMARSLDEGRRELLNQNERLAAAERHKSELISMVSHEVRTPLASLLGFTDLLLRRDPDPATRRRYLEILHQQSRRLASLTTDFLDARLLEEGRLELNMARVDLAEVVREQAQVFVAGSEKHPLVVDLHAEPIWVEGDRDRLSQVVGNLVANAIKYSPDGGDIELRSTEHDGRVELEVRDHGMGIPLEDQPLIFTKFYRGHAAGSGIPGTGLGLAIANELVHAHGGTLDFESEVGRGTTFRLELPAASDDAAAENGDGEDETSYRNAPPPLARRAPASSRRSG